MKCHKAPQAAQGASRRRRLRYPRRVIIRSKVPFDTPSLIRVIVYLDDHLCSQIAPKVTAGPAKIITARRTAKSQWDIVFEGCLAKDISAMIDLLPTITDQRTDFSNCIPMGASVGPVSADRAQWATGCENSIRHDAVSDHESEREWLVS